MKDRIVVILSTLVLVLCCGSFAAIHAAPGDLDTSFGGTGFMREAGNIGTYDLIFATALQPDGKLVSIGWHSSIAADGDILGCGVTRHNADGSLDISFDGDGKMVVPIAISFECRDVAVPSRWKAGHRRRCPACRAIQFRCLPF